MIYDSDSISNYVTFRIIKSHIVSMHKYKITHLICTQ